MHKDKRPLFARQTEKLIRGHQPFLKENGDMNVAKAARAMGLQQPTLQRVIDGQGKSIHQQTESALLTFFGVTKSKFYDEDKKTQEKATIYLASKNAALELDDDDIETLSTFVEFLKWRKSLEK